MTVWDHPGWCYSDLDFNIGKTEDAVECWKTCESFYGDELEAIDWWPEDTEPDGCYCQNRCDCHANLEI